MIFGKDGRCLAFIISRVRMAAWLNMFAIQAPQHLWVSAQHRNAFFFCQVVPSRCVVSSAKSFDGENHRAP